MKKLLSVLLVMVMLCACVPAVAEMQVNTDLSGTITIWDWDGSGNRLLAEEFNKYYPNVKVEVVDVAWADYMEKLQGSIISGLDVPDILLGEGWRGQLFEMGICENLEAEPYNLNRDDMVASSVPLMCDQSGHVVGVEMQVATAGLAYKRSVAKEVLGTDDPDEIAKMIPDWESFKQVGLEVAAKTDGRVKMMPSLGDVLLVTTNQSATDFIGEDGTVDISSRMKTAVDTTIEMRDAGIIGTIEIDSAAWYAAYASPDYLFYECPSWCASLVIPKNAEETKGDWAVTKAPGASLTVGGTSVSIYSGSKNKDAAWAFVKFAYFSEIGGSIMYEKIGNYTCYKPYYTSEFKPYEVEGPYDAFFGGQSLIEFYTTVLTQDAPNAPKTKYDSMIDTTLRKLSTTFMKDTDITAEQALNMFKEEIQLNTLDATIK